MKLPRDLSGCELGKALAEFGYVATRQTGDHVRLTTHSNGEHHITIPQHHTLRVGTLHAILDDVAAHLAIRREELEGRLFGEG